MNYYELSFTYTSPIEKEIINDVLAAELGEIGFESFTESEKGLLGYISEALYDKKTLDDKLVDFPLENTRIDYTSKWVESKDWNEEWEKNYFKPIRIGSECIIRASFHEAEPGYTYNIIIDPKMAFGTGNHETTYLMISEMLKLDLEGKELLDMGCGTAVLAILARLKGAKRVAAIDIDEWAYENCVENIRANSVETRVTPLLGDIGAIAGRRYDFIAANINRNILLAQLPAYAAALDAGGWLLMSGILEADVAPLSEAARAAGFSVTGHALRDGWARVDAVKN